MKTDNEDRAAWLAEYIIKNNATVRQAAAWSGISKSTVHSDVTKKLEKEDSELYERVRAVLDENKAQRHMRGGLATRAKWKSKVKESADCTV